MFFLPMCQIPVLPKVYFVSERRIKPDQGRKTLQTPCSNLTEMQEIPSKETRQTPAVFSLPIPPQILPIYLQTCS